MIHPENFSRYLVSLSSKIDEFESKEEMLDAIKDKFTNLTIPSGTHIEVFIVNEYGYTFEELRIKSKKAIYVNPRQVAMYLLKRDTRLSLSQIGNKFNKDHATVATNFKTKNLNMDFDPQFKAIIDKYDAL